MPGMGTGLNENNPTIVSAFHATLRHQGLVVLLILVVLVLVWNALRLSQLRRAPSGDPSRRSVSRFAYPEPAARRWLRISFGVLWIFDGVLQAQASMPLGMVPQVIEPSAAASPRWVQHLDNLMATIWSYHPIAAPAAAVWIQIGIGLWLLVAPRGEWSRLAGVASVAWGLIVWVFGEAFGGIFAPGLTWLFGAPGAVVFYCLAGALVAQPERYWATPRLGRGILRLAGSFLVGMAVLQAWPGRGFWQGQAGPHASPGTLTSMVQQMAQTSQPHLLSSWVAGFEAFDAAHGWAVNLFAVAALAAIGVAFLTAKPAIVRVALIAGVVICLADWVLIEDLGFMGGVGTDPNSMIPMALLFIAGYLALTRAPSAVSDTVSVPIPAGALRPGWERFMSDPSYSFRTFAALAAIGVTFVGAAPMAVAATRPHADPILARALDGTPDATDIPTPSFTLVDQHSQVISLGGLQGKTVALTFLDPVCTTDCPIIAQEFRAADALLGAASSKVELVAIDANPRYTTPGYLAAFDQQENLWNMANWLYLTGSLPELEHVWGAFGVEVAYETGGAMIAHSDVAYVIDPSGHTRFVLDFDPGPNTEATRSSFSVTLADALKSALRES